MVNATNDIHQYSALIVGAGRFSRNYRRAMADINHETRSRSSGPAFDPVMVTRTRYDKAHAMASEVRQRHGEAFKSVLVDMQYTYHCQRFLESTQYLFNSPNRGKTQ
jgi:hypothetical protein